MLSLVLSRNIKRLYFTADIKNSVTSESCDFYFFEISLVILML